MKKLILSLALFVALPALAATEYYCDCNTGAAVGCVAGSDANDGTTPALAKQLFSTYVTRSKTAAAGSVFAFCEGGSWHSASQTVATGNNWNNANATAANPITTTSYDASSVWSGGAGTKPLWTKAGSGSVLHISQGTINAARNGAVWDNIHIDSDGTASSVYAFVGNSTNYVTFSRMTFNGGSGGGIQCNGGASNPAAGGVALNTSKHLTVRDSTFTNNAGQAILSSCDFTLIEGNTFDKNSGATGAHHIYMSGLYQVLPTPTIASITGDGTIATVTCTGSCGLSSEIRQSITIAGSTPSDFNGTTKIITYVDDTHFTYVCTTSCSGTASGYTASNVRQVLVHDQAVIRNNTLTNLSTAGPGDCDDVALVVHGIWRNMLIENNLLREDTVPTASSCWGISVDAGYNDSVNPPQGQEGFARVVVRGNTVINFVQGIGVDLCDTCLIENNYVTTEFASGARGIAMRSKVSSAVADGKTIPTRITMRHNAVHLQKPGASGKAYTFNAHASDAASGTGHSFYGNVAVLGSSGFNPTATTMCLDTANLALSQFTRKDRNFCYYFGATVPAWENSSSLAAIQAGGDANKSDLNSIMAATTSVTTGQPFWSSPTTSPAITADSALIGGGYSASGLKPYSAWGGVRRDKSTADAGPSEQGATTVTPNSQTGVAVQ